MDKLKILEQIENSFEQKNPFNLEKLSQIIKVLMLMQINIKIFHWQTTKYSEHIALGEYYDYLADKIDLIVEVFQGKMQNKINFSNELTGFEIKNLENSIDYITNVKILFQIFKNNILQSENQLEENSDIINILEEMIAQTNKTIYLLSLN